MPCPVEIPTTDLTDDGAAVASVVVYLLPIVAIALGALVLDETPTMTALVGTAIILTGIGSCDGVPIG